MKKNVSYLIRKLKDKSIQPRLIPFVLVVQEKVADYGHSVDMTNKK